MPVYDQRWCLERIIVKGVVGASTFEDLLGFSVAQGLLIDLMPCRCCGGCRFGGSFGLLRRIPDRLLVGPGFLLKGCN